MKSLVLLLLTTAVYADGLVARHRGEEFNIHVRHEDGASHQPKTLSKRASCGKGAGSCPKGQCCSESGQCGTMSAYCTSPECQMAYSNGNCDGSKKPKGETTANIPRSTTGKAPYDKYIITCTTPGIVALTFDDGPYKYTNQVLDVLKKHNIKATFFITGNNLGKGQIDDHSKPWPKILRRMHSEGHQLASHSWSHQDLSAASDEIRKQQIIYNEMAFRNVLGFFPKYLRPPYGTCSRDSGCLDYVTKLGYHVVNWNIDTKDYLNDSPSKIQTSKNTFSDSVSTDSKSNSYIELSHDIHEQTAYNLTEFMIKTLKARGYHAVPVGECLGDARQSKEEAVTILPYFPSNYQRWYLWCQDGLKCTGSKWGNCCSYYNFCGSTSGYCDGGCQSKYGECNKIKLDSKLIVSDNGLCGEKYHQTCAGSRYGNCCSKYGNCGKTSEYCASGCRSGFGTCPYS
ncbi:hypothetical protein NXS19_007458 [Fusarium pseudograminearum]|nr:hypothetical protein NXS19_007458 [Fusarium pseudograminearum]